jgi:hypothetical protein
MKHGITGYSNMIGDACRGRFSFTRPLHGFTLDTTIDDREGPGLRGGSDERCLTVGKPKPHRKGMSEINAKGKDVCQQGICIQGEAH